jgi:DNA-directed RNA polymerase subunit F
MSVVGFARAILVLSLVQAGCNDKALQTTAASDAGKHFGGTITAEQASKVLAKVGDHTITLGDFVAAIEHMDQFDRLRYQSAEKRRELLAEMINIQLLADEAEAKGYDKDPRVQVELRSTLREAMLAQLHEGAPTSGDIPLEDVRSYYEQHRAMFRDPERRRVSVVVLPDEAAAKTVLDAARHANATQWGELVKQKSVDPTAKANVPIDLAGDLGLVSPPGDTQGEPNLKVPPEVRAALFQLEHIGDVYDKPVAALGKFYVLKMTQKTDAHDRSFLEAERSIRVKLVQDKLHEREEAFIAQLKSEFPVQIDDAVLATVHVEATSDAGTGAGTAAPAPSASAAPHP